MKQKHTYMQNSNTAYCFGSETQLILKIAEWHAESVTVI